MNTGPTSAQVVIDSSSLHLAPWIMEQFAGSGFEVGPLVGVSFSITAPAERFEEFFQLHAERQAPRASLPDELPVSALPPALQEHVDSVLFTRPPDFGPTSY
jgi:hypothetical protein